MTATPFPSHHHQRGHPLRRPDWRWLAARSQWDQGGEPSDPRDDVWVRKALRLHRALHQEKNLQKRTQLSALFQAYQLYCDESLRRWEVEARLLTDEPLAQIAAKCGSTPGVINAFEKVFFNVRDRLEATGYIVTQVIGNNGHLGSREDDVGTILKLFAFGGGVAVLETVLDYFRNPPVMPERPELLPAADLAELRQRLLVKLAVVSRCLPPDGKVFRKLALLDEARAVIAPGGGEGAFPSLPSPPLPTVMSFFGDGVGSPNTAGNVSSAPAPAEPDPGRPDPDRNAQPLSPAAKAPAPRKGRQKVAVA